MANRNHDKMVLQSVVLQWIVGVAKNSIYRCQTQSLLKTWIYWWFQKYSLLVS